MKINADCQMPQPAAFLMVLMATVAVVVQCAPPGATNAPVAASGKNGGISTLLKQMVGAGTSASVSANQPTSTTTTASTTTASSSTTAASAPRDGVTELMSAAHNDQQLHTFDGRNPFGDESLWRIPIHLVRDASVSASPDQNQRRAVDDQMANSASELSAADEHERDDDADSAALTGDEQRDITSLLAHQKASAAASSASSAPTIISASTDLKTAAGYHHATPHHGYEHHAEPSHYGHHDAGHYGKYFQYASVPYPYAWDFGYRRGNPYHTIERYEHGKGPHFQTKVKWSDKHGGYGVHVWDYNHDDHSNYGHHGGHHYDAHAPAHYGNHGHHGDGH